MAKVQAEKAEQNGAISEEEAQSLPVNLPGQVSPEEAWTLYQAAEIKVRALTEQNNAGVEAVAYLNGINVQVMEMLGIDTPDKIVPALEKALKNRQQRRAKPQPQPRATRAPAKK